MLAKISPGPVQTVLLQLGKDVEGVVSQRPTAPGASRLAVSRTALRMLAVLLLSGFLIHFPPASRILSAHCGWQPQGSIIQKKGKVLSLPFQIA